MSLPHLLKYIYNNGTDEVIRRGKRIFASGGVELIEADPVLKSASFRVKSDTHANYYRVSVNKYHDSSAISVRCQCPYNLGEICRHEAAALFQLQEMLDKNHFENFDSQYDQQHTVIKMRTIDLKTIKLLTSSNIFADAEKLLRKYHPTIVSAKDEKVEAMLELPNETYQLIIQKNEERNFDTHCQCDEHEFALCVHKTALFLHLLNQYGPYYFDSLRNWDKEKNKLLSLYGYSLEDNLDGKFAFSYNNGKPFLRVLDPSIKKVESAMPSPKEEPPTQTIAPSKRIGVVLNANETLYPYFSVDLITGEANEEGDAFVTLISKLDLTKYIDYYQFKEQDREVIAPTRKLQQSEINKFLNKNSPFAGIWDNIIHESGDSLPTDTKELILEYLHPKLVKYFNQLSEQPLVFILKERQAFKTKSLLPVNITGELLQISLHTKVEGDQVIITASVQIEDEEVNLADNEWSSPMVFIHNSDAYLFKIPFDALQAELYQNQGNVKVPLSGWGQYLNENLLPLGKDYPISFDPALMAEVSGEIPEYRVQLKEIGDTFVIQPTFNYRGHDVEWNNETQITIQEDNKVLVIHRNKEAEEEFIQKLRGLHTSFAAPTFL